jgi:general secretion pathway protein A
VSFDLGIKVTERSKAALLRGLYSYLLVQLQKGLTTVLVIDEAHQAPCEVLEEVRLLTNLETSEHKLIQIVLVGQPELDGKLDSYELRQLKQRITIRTHLQPYTIVETCQYIEQRLKRAGAKNRAIFPLETVEAIQRYSTGIPRLINSICDQSLVAAYARQAHTVPPEIVEEVAGYFRLHPAPEITENPDSPEFVAEKREAAKYLLQMLETLKGKPAAHRALP